MRVQITDPAEVAKVAKAAGITDLPEGAALTITAPKSVSGRLCADGCGQTTSGGLWMPGHDAKHKSKLYGYEVAGLDPEASDVQKQRAADARDELERRGWGHPAQVLKATATA